MHKPLAPVLDVAVEDGRVGVQAQFVRDAVNVEPDVGANLALEGLIVDAVVEDLGPAAGERTEPRGFEPLENPADSLATALGPFGGLIDLGDAGEVDNLDGGEGLDVQVAA